MKKRKRMDEEWVGGSKKAGEHYWVGLQGVGAEYTQKVDELHEGCQSIVDRLDNK